MFLFLSSSFIQNIVFSSMRSTSFIRTETQIDIHVRCPVSGLVSTSLNSTTVNEKISSLPQLEIAQITQNFITIISNK